MNLNNLLSELTKPTELPQEIQDFIIKITAQRNILGILYYGSSLWAKDTETILDFYIICETLPDWYKGWNVKAIANYLLPPNVEYIEYKVQDRVFKAKIAIITLKHFYKACTINSLDTTIWARFSQPTQLIWVKDSLTKEYIQYCLKEAIKTASFWAAILGPIEGISDCYWLELFKQTYRTELRVEAKNRPMLILKGRENYFNQILEIAWKELPLPFEKSVENVYKINISPSLRRKYLNRWIIRTRLGKPLNIIRLLKAVFTFENGVHYILWKINKHKAVRIVLSPFEINHPLLCLPSILFKLFKNKVF